MDYDDYSGAGRIDALEADNAKLREDYRCSCIESDTLLLDVKAWRSKYERLRDAVRARFEPVGTVQPTVVSKDDLERIIDAIEKEGE